MSTTHDQPSPPTSAPNTPPGVSSGASSSPTPLSGPGPAPSSATAGNPSATARLELLARRFLTPGMSRVAKRVAVPLRYRAQLNACRAGFKEHGSKYTQRVLFVAGLPKSGTTWLEKIVSSYPGFSEVLIPEVTRHELATGGSHDFDLPADTFTRFKDMLVLTKMHVHGSMNNARVLRDSGIPYVVLFRDLRDVAVSNYFYVRNTPWHPEHPYYKGKSVEDGLGVFAARTLLPYADWVRSWQANRDPQRSTILRYEDMLADTVGCLTRVAKTFELPGDERALAELAERFSFKRMSGGRAQGQADPSRFVRKGVAGDWVNHFTPRLRDIYKEAIGDFLIEYGYERDTNW